MSLGIAFNDGTSGFILAPLVMSVLGKKEREADTITEMGCYLKSLSLFPNHRCQDERFLPTSLLPQLRETLTPYEICMALFRALEPTAQEQAQAFMSAQIDIDTFFTLIHAQMLGMTGDNAHLFLKAKATEDLNHYVSQYCAWLKYIAKRENKHEPKTVGMWIQQLKDDNTQLFVMNEAMHAFYATLTSVPLSGALRSADKTLQDAVHSKYITAVILPEQYGLRAVDWHPEQSIHGLIATLKRSGYLLMGGNLGCPFYTEAAKTKEVLGINVHYWRSGAFRESPTRHSIIVIGAVAAGTEGFSESKDMVFYLDPSSDSQGARCSVYMCSYENFCKRVKPRAEHLKITVSTPDGNTEQLKSGFAMCHPDWAKELQAQLDAKAGVVEEKSVVEPASPCKKSLLFGAVALALAGGAAVVAMSMQGTTREL